MFKFNFSPEDLEVDETDLDLQTNNQQDDNDDEVSKTLTNPLENLFVSNNNSTSRSTNNTSLLPPPPLIEVPAAEVVIHSKDCVSSLPPTLHFEEVHIPIHGTTGTTTTTTTGTGTATHVRIYKRNLEDVKFQILQEDDSLSTIPPTTTTTTTNTTTTEGGPKTSVTGLEMLELADKSDLVKGVYEGGLKTWECSLDLVGYLSSNLSDSYDDKKVLELGCGSALPGIYILGQSDSVKVDLQDYNDQVLKLVTLPNVLLNTVCRPDLQPTKEEKQAEADALEKEDEEKEKMDDEDEVGEEEEEDDDDVEVDDLQEQDSQDGDFEGIEIELPGVDQDRLDLVEKVSNQVRLFMGDWSTLPRLLVQNEDQEDEKYDLILTSETIYAEENHGKLYQTIKRTLKRTGRCLVAAKAFYFGVGGDILSFQKMIEKDGVFDVKVVFSAQAFVRREILELTFKK